MSTCRNKDWMFPSQDNVSEWSNMSICLLLLQWAKIIKIQISLLVLYKVDIIIISWKTPLYSSWKFLTEWIRPWLSVWRFNITHYVVASTCSITTFIHVSEFYLWVIYDNIYVVWFLFVSKCVFLRLPRIGLHVSLRRIPMISDQMEPCWTSDRSNVISSMTSV